VDGVNGWVGADYVKGVGTEYGLRPYSAGGGLLRGQVGRDAGLFLLFLAQRTTREFTDWLDGLGTALSPFLGSPTMILGDFNARSIAWDNGVNERGDPLLDWMSGFDFTLLNRDRAPTTFHPRGVSSVDTSWANRGAIG